MVHQKLFLLSLGLLPLLAGASPQVDSNATSKTSKSGRSGPSKGTQIPKLSKQGSSRGKTSSTSVTGSALPPPVDGAGGIPLWRPKAGAKFQIVLGDKILKLDANTPLVPDAEIFDVDMWHTPKSVIQELRRRNKKVICYFSAGGSEDWRPDNNLFPKQDIGDKMAEWPGERWLNVRSPDVWKVMETRIKYAYDKGCNAIDPDNLDAFNHESKRGGGFTPKLTQQDAVVFLSKLSNEAAKYGMSTGLKNIEELIEQVHPYIHFAVNEECASMTKSEGCAPYKTLLAQDKPVFHIEYVKQKTNSTTAKLTSTNSKYNGYSRKQLDDLYCQRTVMSGKKPLPAPEVDLLRGSTVIKLLSLDGWTLYCDGSIAETATSPLGAENVAGGKSTSSSGKSGRSGSGRFGSGRAGIVLDEE